MSSPDLNAGVDTARDHAAFALTISRIGAEPVQQHDECRRRPFGGRRRFSALLKMLRAGLM